MKHWTYNDTLVKSKCLLLNIDLRIGSNWIEETVIIIIIMFGCIATCHILQQDEKQQQQQQQL